MYIFVICFSWFFCGEFKEGKQEKESILSFFFIQESMQAIACIEYCRGLTKSMLRVLSIMVVLHVNSATAFTLPLPCLYRHGPVQAQKVRAQGVRMAAIKVALIQTGGTIDKDYPRSSMGYAFEIADPATERIIADASHVPLSVDFEQHTVCRKVETFKRQQGLYLILNYSNS